MLGVREAADVSAAALRAVAACLHWLLSEPAPAVLRCHYATARGEVWAALDCLVRAVRHLDEWEARR